MDSVSIASTLIAARQSDTQLAIAMKMMRMNADSAQAVVQLLDAGQQNIERLLNVSAGVGGNLDVSA